MQQWCRRWEKECSEPSPCLQSKIIDLQLRNAREKAREMVLQATQAAARGSDAVSKLQLKELGLKPSDLRKATKTVDDTHKVPELPTRLVYLDSLAHTAGCFGVAFSGSGAKLASCGADGLVKVWDALPRNGIWAQPTVLRVTSNRSGRDLSKPRVESLVACSLKNSANLNRPPPLFRAVTRAPMRWRGAATIVP